LNFWPLDSRLVRLLLRGGCRHLSDYLFLTDCWPSRRTRFWRRSCSRPSWSWAMTVADPARVRSV